MRVSIFEDSCVYSRKSVLFCPRRSEVHLRLKKIQFSLADLPGFFFFILHRRNLEEVDLLVGAVYSAADQIEGLFRNIHPRTAIDEENLDFKIISFFIC